LKPALADFRPRGPFFTFRTEVSCLAFLLTYAFFAIFLVSGVSFLPCLPADFRPPGLFSAFRTEVYKKIFF
jgi:hypothetical protein